MPASNFKAVAIVILYLSSAIVASPVAAPTPRVETHIAAPFLPVGDSNVPYLPADEGDAPLFPTGDSDVPWLPTKREAAEAVMTTVTMSATPLPTVEVNLVERGDMWNPVKPMQLLPGEDGRPANSVYPPPPKEKRGKNSADMLVERGDMWNPVKPMQLLPGEDGRPANSVYPPPPKEKRDDGTVTGLALAIDLMPTTFSTSASSTAPASATTSCTPIMVRGAPICVAMPLISEVASASTGASAPTTSSGTVSVPTPSGFTLRTWPVSSPGNTIKERQYQSSDYFPPDFMPEVWGGHKRGLTPLEWPTEHKGGRQHMWCLEKDYFCEDDYSGTVSKGGRGDPEGWPEDK